MERLNPELASLVDAERAEVEPSAAELESVRRRVLLRATGAVAGAAAAGTVAKSAAGAAAGAGAAASAGGGLALKIGAALAVVGMATSLAVPAWRAAHAPPAAPTSSASQPAAAVAVAATAPADVERQVASSARGIDAPSAVSPAPSARRAVPAPEAKGNEAERAPAPPLAEEVKLLKEAQRALRAGQPAVALAALAEHERRFPAGQLSLDRSAARIGALCAMGRTAEARRAGAAFLARHAGCALAEQVRASCGGSGAPE